jgi:hypothetical protein
VAENHHEITVGRRLGKSEICDRKVKELMSLRKVEAFITCMLYILFMLYHVILMSAVPHYSFFTPHTPLASFLHYEPPKTAAALIREGSRHCQPHIIVQRKVPFSNKNSLHAKVSRCV